MEFRQGYSGSHHLYTEMEMSERERDENITGNSTIYKINDSAYIVMVMHSAKYYSAVCGLLLGAVDKSCVRIEEALPLGHSDLSLYTTPLAETALLLAEQRAILTSRELVGLYFANDIPTDNSIPTPPTRIADRIRDKFSKAVLLHIDATRLTPAVRGQKHCARVCSKGKALGTWGQAVHPDRTLSVSERALRVADRVLTIPTVQGTTINVSDVVDFEDHCLDPRFDWLNADLISRLEAISLS